MGYKLFERTGWSAYAIKTNASIPSQDNMTIGDGYVDCANIDIPTEIRDIIGEGSNDLGTICSSLKVNKWSYYGPYQRTQNPLGEGYFILKVPFDMANFLGYNHLAMPPSYLLGVTASTGKSYDSVSGLFPFTIHATVAKGERMPDVGEQAWEGAVVKFTYNGQVIWSAVNINSTNYATAVFEANTGNAEIANVNIKTYYTSGVTGSMVGAIALTGYGDGHFYGKLIEDPQDNKDYEVFLAAVSPTLYCNFTASLTWDGSKKWISIAAIDPAGYNYTYSEWTATNGTIVNVYGNYIAVTLTTIGGIPNSGDFSVHITASQSGMITVAQTFTLSIRNNVIYRPLN